MKKIFLLLCLVWSCVPKEKASTDHAEIFHLMLEKITDVIVHDVFSPPIASRVYA
jgi:hypothetical protein